MEQLRKCPRCGADVMDNATFCGNCGQSMGLAPVRPSIVALRIASAILAGLVALPAGLAGGCVVLLSLGTPDALPYALIGLALIALAGGLIALLVWSFKKR